MEVRELEGELAEVSETLERRKAVRDEVIKRRLAEMLEEEDDVLEWR